MSPQYPPLYGRDRELRIIASAARRAREGAAEVLVFSGPPGVGLTTLCHVPAVLEVDEGQLAGAEVAQIIVEDPEGDSIGYDIRGSNCPLDANSGVIWVTTPDLDAETQSTYDCQVVVTDDWSRDMWGDPAIYHDFTLLVRDVDAVRKVFSPHFAGTDLALFAPGAAPEPLTEDLTLALDAGDSLGAATQFSGLTLPGGLSVPSVGGLDMEVSGRAEVSTWGTLDLGAMNVSLPYRLALTLPDEVTPGATITVDSSAEQLDGAGFVGRSPSLTLNSHVSFDDFTASVRACLPDCEEVSTGTIDVDQDLLDLDFPEQPFGSVTEADGTLVLDRVVAHRIDDMSVRQGIFAWALDADEASLFQPSGVIDLREHGDGFRVDWEAWTGAGGALGWSADLVHDIEVRVVGIAGELYLEDGSTVWFDVGESFELTLPASADVNGDGNVKTRFAYTPRIEVTYTADMSAQADWSWRLLYARAAYYENNVPEEVIRRGPVLEGSVRAESNDSYSSTFELDLAHRHAWGVIDLAE